MQKLLYIFLTFQLICVNLSAQSKKKQEKIYEVINAFLNLEVQNIDTCKIDIMYYKEQYLTVFYSVMKIDTFYLIVNPSGNELQNNSKNNKQFVWDFTKIPNAKPVYLDSNWIKDRFNPEKKEYFKANYKNGIIQFTIPKFTIRNKVRFTYYTYHNYPFGFGDRIVATKVNGNWNFKNTGIIIICGG